MTTNNPSSDETTDHEIVSRRIIAAPRDVVFQAFSDPAQLARWFGPKGFTNTFHAFELRPGGAWRFTMHGPDGANYENQNRFTEIVPPERIIYQHLQPMHSFSMTMTFAEQSGKTELTWRMVFESAAEVAKLRGFIAAANEQNFDRLETHLATCNREIVISRVFDAPRELVWQAMSEPRHVVNWWGPRGFSTTTKRMDFRVGGVWEHTMHGPDGANYPNKSIFKEIVLHERIVYSHGGHRENGPGTSFVATWTFEDAGPGKTKLTIRQVFGSSDARDFTAKEFGAIEGGKQTLARLAEYLPTMAAASPSQ